MEKKIEVPEEYSDIIESAEKTRSGQTRKYGPYEEVYNLQIKADKPSENEEKRILEFCQGFCHKCRHSEKELLEIKRDRNISFEDSMKAIVEGSYTLSFYPDQKRVCYKWSQDYLD